MKSQEHRPVRSARKINRVEKDFIRLLLWENSTNWRQFLVEQVRQSHSSETESLCLEDNPDYLKALSQISRGRIRTLQNVLAPAMQTNKNRVALFLDNTKLSTLCQHGLFPLQDRNTHYLVEGNKVTALHYLLVTRSYIIPLDHARAYEGMPYIYRCYIFKQWHNYSVPRHHMEWNFWESGYY